MTDFVMIVRLRLILFWLLTSTCAIGAKQLVIKDVGPSLPALVSYDTIHKAFNDESSNVYLAQTHDLHTSADRKHLSNSAEFNKIAAKQSLIPFLAYCVATNKTVGLSDDIAATFKNGNATRVVLDKPLTVSRFHGGKSGQIGRFASGDAFNSRRAVRQRLALKQEWGNRISKQSDVALPEGTVIWRGQAAPQLQKNGKLLRGGGDQIWIESDLNPACFNNTAHFK